MKDLAAIPSVLVASLATAFLLQLMIRGILILIVALPLGIPISLMLKRLRQV